ncbi:hypothetical protein [Desulfonauticus submarinus]
MSKNKLLAMRESETMKNMKSLTTDHQSTVTVKSFNRIGDDLLKAKWYFLAILTALGVAYRYVFCEPLPFISLLVVGALGNIVFWMLGEYIVSQGFLFRYLQTKTISIIKDGCLSLDYILPDQFMPLYWASLWAIILNTGTAIYLYTTTPDLPIFIFLCFSLFLIWKLLSYHLYKIRQFLTKTISLKLVPACAEEKNFFRFPLSAFYGLPLGGGLSYLNWLFETKTLPWYYWLILPLFWPLGLAMVVHLRRGLDVLSDKERRLPIKMEGNKYVIQIDSKTAWAYWLLYFIV